ncbi:MAG: tRNA (N6-isopentenyl adenosine(37)-C2)-methylthiotransferase MiaB [Coriobacteriia bacterium]|nr:tRNA (N6-isopentenyl adenosine(37)-C2)-methylthiotransferase MiaB [Coriobacteriia bacterium]
MDTFVIRTFGCQMNKHDSERISGLLSAAGMRPVSEAQDAHVIVFMTCCVRENADERLIGQVASLKALKPRRGEGPLIAVGGCIGQRDGERLIEQVPHIDVVFGTHNVSRLPFLLQAARDANRAQVEVLAESTEFTSDLPSEREHPWHAWLPITVGCNNFCSYCVVPHVRGRERSRSMEAIVLEAQHLVADGVLEITLLGQNVNSYGRDLFGEPRFAEILRRVADTGVQRIRFATSHPKDLLDETIRVMTDTPAVMPYLHLPVQSGSDAILARMNRHYTAEHYLELVEKLYSALPHMALSTDVIVGFPGETEDDFERTLHLVQTARVDQAFTFIYSPREGTPAASMGDQVPREVSQVRFDRLVDLVQRSAFAKNKVLTGTVQPVLFTGTSKRDPRVLAGRTPGNKVVHVTLGDEQSASSFAGKVLDVSIEDAQTWFLSGRLLGTNP